MGQLHVINRLKEYDYLSVINSIEEIGYKVGDRDGTRSIFPEYNNGISIIDPNALNLLRRISRSIGFIPRGHQTGILWFYNDLPPATPTDRWALQVFGDEHLEDMLNLGNHLWERHKVPIRTYLYSEQFRLEKPIQLSSST